MSTNRPAVAASSCEAALVQSIIADINRQLVSCTTIDDLQRISKDLSARLLPNNGNGSARTKKRKNHDNGDQNDSAGDDLDKKLAAVRKAIRGKLSPKLRSRTSKMKIQIPLESLDIFAALCGKDPSSLKKKGAFYEMEEVMPKDLLPGVFEESVPEKKRFWYTARDEDGMVKTSNGWPKSVNTSKACELRYKPSTRELSVSCWNSDFQSWEGCCNGITIN